MEEGSKAMTAFTVSSGCYQFKRMSFELMNTAATFNRVMRKMLDGVQNIEHFIDDVLTHAATWDDHIKALNPFSARPIFGQVQNFFLENLLLARFFMERYIKRHIC